jgi:hypothetical protein
MRDLAADPLSLWYPIAISILQNWLPNTQFEATAYGGASIATLERRGRTVAALGFSLKNTCCALRAMRV